MATFLVVCWLVIFLLMDIEFSSSLIKMPVFMVGIFYGSSNLGLDSEWMGGSVVNSRDPPIFRPHTRKNVQVSTAEGWSYPDLPRIMGLVKHGCISNRILTFQIQSLFSHFSLFSTSRIMGGRAFERSCWRTKSCTTKDDDYPIICRGLTIPGGCLGFLPSTVSSTKLLPVQRWWPLIHWSTWAILKILFVSLFSTHYT